MKKLRHPIQKRIFGSAASRPKTQAQFLLYPEPVFYNLILEYILTVEVSISLLISHYMSQIFQSFYFSTVNDQR